MSDERSKLFRKLLQPRVMNTIMAGCIVALGVLYIGQVNASANKALQVAALEQQRAMLVVDTQRTAAKIDELRSLDNVLQRQQFLGLVAVENIDYIRAGVDAVALR